MGGMRWNALCSTLSSVRWSSQLSEVLCVIFCMRGASSLQHRKSAVYAPIIMAHEMMMRMYCSIPFMSVMNLSVIWRVAVVKPVTISVPWQQAYVSVIVFCMLWCLWPDWSASPILRLSACVPEPMR